MFELSNIVEFVENKKKELDYLINTNTIDWGCKEDCGICCITGKFYICDVSYNLSQIHNWSKKQKESFEDYFLNSELITEVAPLGNVVEMCVFLYRKACLFNEAKPDICKDFSCNKHLI